MCQCREGIVNKYDDQGVKIAEEKTNLNVHNCEYIGRRNELIRDAEKAALQQVGVDQDGKVGAGFSRAFIRLMDEAAIKAGIKIC